MRTILGRNQEFYRSLLSRRPPDESSPNHNAQVVGYKTKERQHQYFESATANVPDIGLLESVLDLGCGLGDFYEFLHERGFRGRYVGIELLPDYADQARRNLEGYPDCTVRCEDFLSTDDSTQFALAVAMGTLSANMDKPERSGPRSAEIASQTIRRLVSSCRDTAAFHFLDQRFLDATRTPTVLEEFAFFNRDWILEQCRAAAREIGRVGRIELDATAASTACVVRIEFP